MKSKMKRQRQTELPRFIVGALATAGASGANGATVQITFDNNFVSINTSTSYFENDLTGDGEQDVTGSANYGVVSVNDAWSPFALLGKAEENFRQVGENVQNTPPANQPLRGIVGYTFQDDRINGGVQTNGFLDITAIGGGNASVRIHRLIFDDASTTAPTGVTSATTGLTEVNTTYGVSTSAVPEASTSLGLLALGAGGILTRRRSKRAA